MKKIVFIIISIILVHLESISQNCTNCSTGNLINSSNFSSALGIDNKSWGLGSFAAGKYDTVTGDQSIGLGFRAYVPGDFSFAAGNIVKSSGYYSLSLGRNLHAKANQSFVIGSGSSSTEILENNNINSLMIGFGSTLPTLFVSTAPANGKTGKIGIGNVTNPTSKLHIKTDVGEDATILIEPWTWASGQWAEIRLGNNYHGVKADAAWGLVFNTQKHYIFNQGNIGVGVTNLPTEKLEVVGNIKATSGYFISDKLQSTGTKGLMLYNGMGSGINISGTGNVGIGVAIPTEKLEVNGKVKSSGLQVMVGQPVASMFLKCLDANGNTQWSAIPDDGDWTIQGNNLYRLYGNVGIGTASPNSRLTITDQTGDIDQNFFVVANENVFGSGQTAIGKLNGNGPSIIQKAGSTNFACSGPALSYIQKSNNDEIGYMVRTYTNLDGSVYYADITAPSSELYIRSKGDMIFRTNEPETEGMRITASGNVGIGKTPSTKLDVNGEVRINGNTEISGKLTAQSLGKIGVGISSMSIGDASGQSLEWGTSYIGFNVERIYNGSWYWETNNDFQSNGGAVIYATLGGEIVFSCIESTQPPANQILSDSQIKNKAKMILNANGILEVNELEVKTNVWSDYVFDENYTLRSLSELESFIQHNKHLPDIPSEKEVFQEGVNVGEMNKLLLQKIEELTLYILDQEKRITELENKLP